MKSDLWSTLNRTLAKCKKWTSPFLAMTSFPEKVFYPLSRNIWPKLKYPGITHQFFYQNCPNLIYKPELILSNQHFRNKSNISRFAGPGIIGLCLCIIQIPVNYVNVVTKWVLIKLLGFVKTPSPVKLMEIAQAGNTEQGKIRHTIEYPFWTICW